MPGPVHLYLVRHAIAEERGPAWPDDSLRPLTDEGARRWRRQAVGLAAIDARPDVILTSPFTRARQTADLLAAAFAKKPKVIELPALQPGVRPREVLRALEPDPRRTSVALVGHEPGLGELAALLVGFKTPPEFKKGGVARIDVAILPPPAGSGALHWWLTPKVLRELA
ncbi:MAG: phosphohistidine phosphatase SixA [Vicinamibacteraceae bacterium]